MASFFGSIGWGVAGAMALAAFGATGCADHAERDEGQKDCRDPENLRLWTLDIDHPDYVALKNTGSCPVELGGLHVMFDDRDDAFADGTGVDCTLELPPVTLPPSASVRVSELPLPGDIDARTAKFEGCMYDLPFFPDRGGVTYLCQGSCEEGTLIDVVAHRGDELYPNYRDPPALRFGAVAEGIRGVTLLNSQWARFQRVATESRFPDYLESDWGLANLTLSADFEAGLTAESLDAEPVPWSIIVRESTEVVTTDETAMSGVASLRITHLVEDGFSSELSQSFGATAMPRDIAYFVRLSSSTGVGGLFEVDSQGTPALRIGFGEEVLGAAMRDANTPFAPDTWYLVELRDVDWTLRHFDLYVDGVLIGGQIRIFDDAHFPDEVRLFTYGAGSAYYDAIELWGSASGN